MDFEPSDDNQRETEGNKKADLLQSAKHMGLGLAEAEKIIDEVGGSISS